MFFEVFDDYTVTQSYYNPHYQKANGHITPPHRDTLILEGLIEVSVVDNLAHEIL